MDGSGDPSRGGAGRRAALHPDTLAVSHGYDPADCFGAAKPPVVMTSTFSLKVRGGEQDAFAMLDRLRVLRMAVSLGGTETLISHSATTAHYAVPKAVRDEVGVDDSSLRISVGIEHPGDLIADLAQALEAIPG